MNAVLDLALEKTILVDHRIRQWRSRHVSLQPKTHRQAFVWGMAAAVAAMAQEACAQSTVAVGTGVAENANPFTTVNAGICTMSNWLRGPVGIGLVLISIVIAGISLAVGGKKSTSILVAALAGAAVILGARSIMSLAAGSTTNICQGTGAATP